ncbi:hypothetical protein EWM64_g2828 [Hericium alpestre]|uniref:Uncharacterized protein n=1 Tax=Hericium alpestre TaxID=135208 RepID=A0A4Z0A692_9AGAM|nr:hypothetical protein EWM64_g2828 [Hericium alpestre]
MPRLQILTLENVLNPTFDDGLPRNHHLVPLAHLSRMRLRCEAAQCVFLMSGLTALPTTARLSLCLIGPRQDLRNAIPMLKPFSMPMNDPYDPLIYVSLDCSKEYGHKTIQFSAANKSSLGHPRGKISLFYQPPDVRWSATLQRLFTELCLGEVEVLDLSGNELYRLTMKGFQVAFGPMKAVRDLRLGKKAGRFSRNGGIVELIEALALPAPRPKMPAKKARASTTDEQDHPLLFPELESLTLVSMNLASRKADGETTYHEVLLEVLETRCTFGVPLQRLILKDCTYKESWLATYGGYVVKVSSEHPGRVLDENFQIPHSTQHLMI